MDITINNKNIVLEGSYTLSQLLVAQQINPNAIAIAINNTIVSRSVWDVTEINDNDKITIIQATYGG